MTTLIYEDVDGIKLINELDELFPEHYEELCVTKEYPYEPDYEAYKRCAEAGMLRTITCRADGELIGYIIFFVSPHLHYKSCITATEDIYFVKKEYHVTVDPVYPLICNLCEDCGQIQTKYITDP